MKQTHIASMPCKKGSMEHLMVKSNGQFSLEKDGRKPKTLTPRQAVRQFLLFVSCGECFTNDLTPLIEAI